MKKVLLGILLGIGVVAAQDASYSEVNIAFDNAEQIIITENNSVKSAVARIKDASSNLNALATMYTKELQTANAYVPTGAVEAYQKDRRAKIVAEYQASVAAISQLIEEIEALGY